MKVTEATQEICDGACQAGCVQLQGRGTGLSATDQGVDMVIAQKNIQHLYNWKFNFDMFMKLKFIYQFIYTESKYLF